MARGRKGKGFVCRYTVPVLPDQQAMVEAEFTYQSGGRADGKTVVKQELLAELICEAVRARMTTRGVEPSQMPAVLPGDAADPVVPTRTVKEQKALCNCGADRTGPSAEAHAAGCPAAGPANIVTSRDLIEAGKRPEVQAAVNREGSGRAA